VPSFPNRVVSEKGCSKSTLKFAQRLLAVRNGFGRRRHHKCMIKLDSSNYSLWKPMKEDIFNCKDLHEPTVKDKISTGVTEEEWRVLNRKDVGMIRLYINHNIFYHVANDTNSYKVWQKL
jgi:hypothetical protein